MLSINSDLNNNGITFLTRQPSSPSLHRWRHCPVPRENIALYYFPSINFCRFIFVTNAVTNFYYYKYICCCYLIFIMSYIYLSHIISCVSFYWQSSKHIIIYKVPLATNYTSHRVLQHHDDVYIYINLCRHTLNETTTTYIILLLICCVGTLHPKLFHHFPHTTHPTYDPSVHLTLSHSHT